MKKYSFENLDVWKEAHKLILEIYKLSQNFPSYEKYSLTDQIRRSSISITSNIAEADGYKSLKEKLRFYYIANGSIRELKSQIIISRDLGYLDIRIYTKVVLQIEIVQKLLLGFIRYTNNKLK